MSRRPFMKTVTALIAAATLHFSAGEAHSSELNIFTIERSKFPQFQRAAQAGGWTASKYVDKLNRDVESLATDNDAQRAAAAFATELGVDMVVGLCEAGPKTCAGGVVGVGAALAVVLPIIFSFKNSNVTIFVANNTDTTLYLEDEYVPYGRMAYWPARKAIPARTRNKVHLGIFVFEKKFGLFGTNGAIQMETTRNGKLKIGYGIPYRDIALIQNKSRCAVSVDRSPYESLRGFTDTLIERYSGSELRSHNNSYVEDGRNYQTACGLTDTSGEFPSMLVSYSETGPSGHVGSTQTDLERRRSRTPTRTTPTAPTGSANIGGTVAGIGAATVGAAFANIYGSFFDKTANAGIPGFNQETVNNVPLQTCMRLCVERSWCKSVDYERAATNCYLQPVNRFEQSLKTTYPGNPYDHYHRKQ